MLTLGSVLACDHADQGMVTVSEPRRRCRVAVDLQHYADPFDAGRPRFHEHFGEEVLSAIDACEGATRSGDAWYCVGGVQTAMVASPRACSGRGWNRAVWYTNGSEVSLVTYGAEGSFSHDGDCAVSALREVYALTGHLSPARLDSAVSQRVACGAVGVPYALGPPPPRSGWPLRPPP